LKPSGILAFLLSLFAVLFAIWFVFPAKGVNIGGTTLRFPNYESYLSDLQNKEPEINVDSVLLSVQKSYEIPQGQEDTLDYFYEYIHSNPNRVYFPGDDYTFLDDIFKEMENARKARKIVRVMHYGDSQLEMDRISANLRENFQNRFGGSGPGMVPMIQKVPTVSLLQSASGNVSRYSLITDSLSNSDANRKYGPLAQFGRVSGSATFSFRVTTNRYCQPRAKQFSKITVLLGNMQGDVSLKIKADTSVRTASVKRTADPVTKVEWQMPHDIKRGTISISGTVDVYGIAIDGGPGVAVDNVALRGCDGGVFSRINPELMADSYREMDTRLIIMQFGGNAMPAISSHKSIARYMQRIERQFTYFKKVAPKAKILFVGPSDMGKSVDGKMVTWPLLPELNDSLKLHCLNNGVAYWDTFHVMGGEGSMAQWVKHSPAFAGPDYIHFTSKGAAEIGNALSKSLLLYDDFRKTREAIGERAVRSYFEKKER
jgi:lysophospholipase L1-like esterase